MFYGLQRLVAICHVNEGSEYADTGKSAVEAMIDAINDLLEVCVCVCV